MAAFAIDMEWSGAQFHLTPAMHALHGFILILIII
jgi:hypothetical protein